MIFGELLMDWYELGLASGFVYCDADGVEVNVMSATLF